AHGDVEVAVQGAVQGRFGHHLAAAGVGALLGVHEGDLPAVAADHDGAAVGLVVRALVVIGAAELEGVAAQLDPVAGRRGDIAFDAGAFGEKHASHEHGDADV